MSGKDEKGFSGFSPEALLFLVNVRLNNSKAWFEENRESYRKYLLEPFRDLAAELGPHILAIDPLLEVTPAVNKTISRIYRDTRFSRDKSLYRDSMWITFKRQQKEWMDAPAFFFEITPGFYRYGMGFYSASSESMNIFRKMIDENPEEFLKAISFYPGQKDFVVEGEQYKRPLDKRKPPEIQEWYNRKNFYLTQNCRDMERIFDRALPDELIRGFNLISPIYHYLCKIGDRKFKASPL